MTTDPMLVIRILQWIRSNGGAYVSEIAQEFNVSEREITSIFRRVNQTGHGFGGGEYLEVFFDEEDGYVSVQDLQYLSNTIRLDRIEATSLISGLRALEIASTPETAAEIKILIQKIQDAASSTGAPIQIYQNEIDANFLQILTNAISSGSCVEIEYVSANQVTSRRIIEPYNVYHLDGLTYIEAWSQNESECRTFRLDRFMAVSEIDVPSTNFANVRESSNFVGSNAIHIHTTALGLENFHTSCVTQQETLESGKISAIVHINSLEWLTGVVMASAGHIEIISPLEAKELLHQRIQAWREHNPS